MTHRLPDDPFLDGQGRPRVVRGVTVISNSPRVAELAGRVGFEAVWIEVEHGTVSFSEVETLCMAAEAGGAYPTVRVPDSSRTHVLRALEAGARIVVVPMVNTPEQAAMVVEYGKFPPLGKRGYNTRSRGMEYGLVPPPEGFAIANRGTHLFVQVETREAVGNLDEICAIQGLSGVFIGPGDLSADFGKPGDFSDLEVISVVTDIVQKARGHGLHAGILVTPGPLFEAAIAAGGDFLFCGGDVADLVTAWKALLRELSR